MPYLLFFTAPIGIGHVRPACSLAPPSSPLLVSGTRSVTTEGPRRTAARRGDKKKTPENEKDQHYRERRDKNNTAAKRSRDQRNKRSQQVEMRVQQMQLANEELRAKVAQMRPTLKHNTDVVTKRFMDMAGGAKDRDIRLHVKTVGED
jgi:hypothetical protein